MKKDSARRQGPSSRACEGSGLRRETRQILRCAQDDASRKYVEFRIIRVRCAFGWIAIFSICTLCLGAAATAPTTQPTTRPVLQQSPDGSVLLHARDVTTHGTTVRYEPQPNKNTIGYWTRKEDWVSWDFVIAHPGKFEVFALQGCGKGSGGSEVEFTAGDQKLKMTVQDTGGFQNFVLRKIGTFNLTAGPHTLAVKPISKPGLAVMDLRQVELKPVK